MSVFAKKIWRFWVSLRLTIFLLILLSAVCVIGTVVPQNESEQLYLQAYKPSTYAVLRATGATDLYHAWWFQLLLGAFTLNLIACSLHRLPRVLRHITRIDPVLTDERMGTLAHVRQIRLSRFTPDDNARFQHTLKTHVASPRVVDQNGTVFFFAESGRFAPLSFFVTHVGIVVIIIGVLVGAFGFQGFMNLAEGESSSVVIDKQNKAQRQLDFMVRCDKFDVLYYETAGMPRDYLSTLTIIDNGHEVLTKTIEVNDPLTYKGIYFYQSSYGIASGGGGEVLLRFVRPGQQEGTEHRVSVNQRFTIAGTQDEGEVEMIVPDFAMDGNGQVFSRSQEPKNPAVRIAIYSPGRQPYRLWSFANFPDFHQKPDAPYAVHFLQYYPRYYTGLQVTRDPGVWIVWVGCCALIVGICMSFFWSHRRVWVRVEKKNDRLYVVTLAGTCSKNKEAFHNLLNRLAAVLTHKGASSC
ncbi:MAG: cytochrome c biogenesis protein ResB [Desulfobacterota bacterium]|nr:cytochrome c biogenesis protein ResB [Thermodesulfobacteriota bacterium]